MLGGGQRRQTKGITMLSEEINEKIREAVALDRNILLRTGKDFDFVDIGDQVEAVLSWLSILVDQSDFIAELPDNRKTSVENETRTILERIFAIRSFDITAGDPNQNRRNLVENFSAAYRGFYEQVILPLKNDYTYRGYDVGEIQSAKDLSKKALKDIQDSLTAVKQATAQTADVQYAAIFEKQSKKFSEGATRWLLASVMVAVFLLVFLLWGANYLAVTISALSNSKQSVNIAESVYKIIVLSIGFYLLKTTLHNYRAQKHLEVMNRHRANTLQSLNVLREAIEDVTYKDFVTAAGARMIFETGETGYLTSKEGAGSGGDFTGAELIELMKRQH